MTIRIENRPLKSIGYIMVVGIIVGIFSVISDLLPYQPDNFIEIVISYLAVLINSLIVWFALSMSVGYLFGHSFKQATLLGAAFTFFAITVYFVMGNLFNDFGPKISVHDLFMVYVKWYLAAIAGGVIGSIFGFLAKKHPVTLLVLVGGMILQLIINGTYSWQNPVGLAQNITYSFSAVFLLFYLFYRWRK